MDQKEEKDGDEDKRLGCKASSLSSNSDFNLNSDADLTSSNYSKKIPLIYIDNIFIRNYFNINQTIKALYQSFNRFNLLSLPRIQKGFCYNQNLHTSISSKNYQKIFFINFSRNCITFTLNWMMGLQNLHIKDTLRKEIFWAKTGRFITVQNFHHFS